MSTPVIAVGRYATPLEPPARLRPLLGAALSLLLLVAVLIFV